MPNSISLRHGGYENEIDVYMLFESYKKCRNFLYYYKLDLNGDTFMSVNDSKNINSSI